MKTTSDPSEAFGQSTTKAVEALTLWTDANQKIARELADLSASAVKEGVELCVRLQSSTLEAVKEGQAFWHKQQSDPAKWRNDPVGWYHASLVETIQEAQKGMKIFQDTFQAMTQTAEHIRAASERTTKEIQQSCSNLAAGVKAVYSPPEN